MPTFWMSVMALWLAVDVPVRETAPAVFHAASPRLAASSAELAMAGTRLPFWARHELPALSDSERASLHEKDARTEPRRKRTAVKIGLSRILPDESGFDGIPGELPRGRSREVSGGLLERLADGRLVWTAGFSSPGAGGLRLHLRSVRLPAGSRVYVYSAAGEVHGPYTFGAELGPEGFWTNAVFAPEVFLEAQIGTGADAQRSTAQLRVDALGHLEHPGFAPSFRAPDAVTVRPKSQLCFIDASCATAQFPNLDQAARAVSLLNFEDTGSFFSCTGGLLNTSPATFAPYLLTANHCFATQASATSLETIWNFRTSSCGGPAPNPVTLPRTLGSTLLATGEASDYTLVELAEDPPDGAVFLGWTTADFAHAGGTDLHRLSYPSGDPMIYTQEEVSAVPDPFACGDAPQGDYIYEKDTVGGTGAGSSGSLLYTANLLVVGQELGACGSNALDDCDVVANSTLDGAFRVSFPALQPFLAPLAPPPASDPCSSGGRVRLSPTLCDPPTPLTLPPR